MALPLFFACYNIYLHPLAGYPGPKLAGATRVWYVYHTLRGRLPFVLTKLHQKYGNVIRIAPDEISYITPEAWNQIYGHRWGKPEFPKDPKFDSSISSGPGNILSSERSRHAVLRKQMSHGFSDRALRVQEPLIRGYADQLVARLTEISKAGTPFHIVRWLNVSSADLKVDII